MSDDAPQLDSRSLDDVVAQTEALATAYTQDVAAGPWQPRPDGTLDLGGALIRLFGRMAAHLIGQLNQVPAKHRLAFTELLGARRTSPQPARAAVTFALDNSAGTGVVPAGAQLAAGAQLFETEQDLPLTRAQLAAAFVRDPAGKGYCDGTAIATGAAPAAGGFSALGDAPPIEHVIYVATEDLLAIAGAQTLTLALDGGASALPASGIKWEASGASGWSTIGNAWTVNAAVAALGPVAVAGITARWLRGTLLVTTAPPPVKLAASVAFRTTAPAAPDAAYYNGQRLDFSRAAAPFGDRPRFNDALFIASDAALANAGAITVAFTFTVPDKGVNAADNPTLEWATWDGAAATVIGTTTAAGAATGLTDTTKAFTIGGTTAGASAAGAVTIALAAPVPRATIGSVTSRWLRVRLVAGDYGQELSAAAAGGGVTITPASFRPPAIASIGLTWSGTAARPPTQILRRTALTYEDITATAQPVAIWRDAPELVFQPTVETQPSLQLGFDRAFEPQLTTIYLQVFAPPAPAPYPLTSAVPPRGAPALAWEYWSGGTWSPLAVEDGTQDLARSGVVRFVAPGDAAPLAQFSDAGVARYWVRARATAAAFAMPRVGRVLVNTMWAANAQSAAQEVLGASNGARGQSFAVAHAPVLDGQLVEVGEPSAAGVAWVAWQEVPDFYGSGSGDRHYVFDAEIGELTFGDGVAGMIPPAPPTAGGKNVRATYRSGGGTAGNVAAGAIAKLKTTVPVVASVTNYEPATGGAEIEPAPAMLDRAARALRHGGRATTADDYADLAREATLAVARAVTISPSFSPITQANGAVATDLQRDGEVLVVVVPAQAAPGAAPSLDLLADVESYLQARAAPGAEIHVIGPSWVGASVEVHVAATSPEQNDAAIAGTRAAIAALLDPLTGGDGGGWDFGRRPRQSDVVAAVAAVPGVDHLSFVNVTCEPPFDFDETVPTTDPSKQLTIDMLSLYSRLLVYAKSIVVTASQPKVAT